MSDELWRFREELDHLGWNVGDTAYSTNGSLLTLRETPYTSNVAGMRTLTIAGPTVDEAIRSFLDELVDVTLAYPVSHASAYWIEHRGPSGPYRFLVKPIHPRKGEDQDIWEVFVDQPDAQRFFDALGKDTVLSIRRGSARLTNVDERRKRNY
ncbi:MAG: hypothetical protein KDA90_21140 [Planctomycetaceae bacterium]|nr:hypothetical protein [Planctomycetaceae bacterium]